MTIKELEKFLIKKGAPRDMYSLSGGLPNEAFCIERFGNKWHLYYSERGCKRTMVTLIAKIRLLVHSYQK